MQKTLPKGWKMVRLGEVCEELKPGFAYGKSDNDLQGIPHLRPMNISIDGRLTWEGTKYIPKENFNNKVEFSLKTGDILLNNTNSKELVGKTCYIQEDIFAVYSNHITRIRVDRTKVDAHFGAILLHNYWQKGFFIDKCHKWVNQAGLNKEILSEIQLPLPPLPTQHKIVEILEEADNLRKFRQQADEKMKDLIPSLFVQMFGDPTKNPKGWAFKKIGDVCNKKTGTRNPSDIADGYFEYVDISSIDNICGTITTAITIPNVEAPSRARKVIKTNDVLVSTVRPNLNAVAIVPDKLNNQICSTGFCVLRIDTQVSNYHYIYAITRTKNFIESMTKKTQGASYPAILDREIFNFQIPLPPLPLQQEFAKLVEDIEAEKARQAESKKKLDELFQSLMQRAFTGELVA